MGRAVDQDAKRAGELEVPLPDRTDARIVFIGRIRTPWASRLECPRQGRADGPICRIEVFEPWAAALDGITAYQRIPLDYGVGLDPRSRER